MQRQLEQSQQTTSFLTQTFPSQARVSQLEDLTMAEGTAQIGIKGDLQLYATEADVLFGGASDRHEEVHHQRTVHPDSCDTRPSSLEMNVTRITR